jgi:hypothetical protein
MLLPPSDNESRQNKGSILKASVDYIQKLQRDVERLRIQDAKQRQLEDTNRKMRLRIQELELTARAHGIPTPSLTPETKQLAEAADKALGTSTNKPRSPLGSTTTTPLSPQLFGGAGVDDSNFDVLRASPGIDLSRLNIKTEPDLEPQDNRISLEDLVSVDPEMSIETATSNLFSNNNNSSYLTSSSFSMANSTIYGES